MITSFFVSYISPLKATRDTADCTSPVPGLRGKGLQFRWTLPSLSRKSMEWAVGNSLQAFSMTPLLKFVTYTTSKALEAFQFLHILTEFRKAVHNYSCIVTIRCFYTKRCTPIIHISHLLGPRTKVFTNMTPNLHAL